MRIRLRVGWLGIGAALAAAALAAPVGAAARPPAAPSDPGPARVAWVGQVGTYGYLTSPDYDGLAPIADALPGAPQQSRTAIGLGTFDHLNGELVIEGGRTYRVGTDGTPRRVTASRLTPFAQAVDLHPQFRRNLRPGTACADVGKVIDRMVGSTLGMVAVRLSGRFTQLQFRSVPRQSKPYPPLADAIAEQVEFPADHRRAVLVGFRSGPDFAGLSADGVHLHGLTANRGRGGHVLSCSTGRGVRLEAQVAAGVRTVGG
jgi:acetolactate decarboxylase